MDHLEHVDLTHRRLALWLEAAERLGERGIALEIELRSVATDPSRHNLRRAARAARMAETRVHGGLALIAGAAALEIETAAERREP